MRNFTKKQINTAIALSFISAYGHTDDDINNSERTVERVSIVGQNVSSLELLGSTSILSEQELEKFAFDDIGQVLSKVPGVNIRQEDGYGLRPNIGFRGVTPNRSKKINILEDGVLIGPAPYSAPAAYYFPLMGKIRQVEVTKGAEMLNHGPNTVAGVLNLVTRSVPVIETSAMELKIGADGFSHLNGHYGNTIGDFGFLFEAHQLQADGFKQLDNGGDTGFDKQDLLFKGNYQWKMGAVEHLLELKLAYADEISNETYLGLSDDDFNTTPYRRYAATQRDKMAWEHEQLMLTHSAQGSDWSSTVRAYHHDFTRNWSKINGLRAIQGNAPASLQTILSVPTNYSNFYQVLTGEENSSFLDMIVLGDNDRDYYSQGLQADAAYQLPLFGWSHELSAGLRFHKDEIQRNHRENDFLMTNGILERATTAERLGSTNLERTEATSSYVKSRWSLDDLTVAVTLRYEYIDGYFLNRLNGEWQSKNDNVLLPALSSVYKLSDEQSLIFGIHKGFVPTSPQQSPDKKPEDSTNVEFGWRFDSNKLQGEIIGFYNQYDNLVETCSMSAGESCTTNIDVQYDAGAVDVYGVENTLSGNLDIASSSLSLPWYVSYTYTQSEFKTSFKSVFKQWGDVTVGESLPYVAEHIISAGLSIEYDRWDISLRSNYQSEMKEAAGQGVNLSGFSTEPLLTLDISAGYDISQQARVYVKLDNATDEIEIVSRRPYGARPNRPQQWFVGYKHQF